MLLVIQLADKMRFCITMDKELKKAPIGAILGLTCSHNQKAYLISPLMGSYAYP